MTLAAPNNPLSRSQTAAFASRKVGDTLDAFGLRLVKNNLLSAFIGYPTTHSIETVGNATAEVTRADEVPVVRCLRQKDVF